MEKYLEAADAALLAAITDGSRPEAIHKTYRMVDEDVVGAIVEPIARARQTALLDQSLGLVEPDATRVA